MMHLDTTRSSRRLHAARILFLAFTLINSTSAFDLTLCSSSNTGSDSPDEGNTYNSVGKCHDACVSQSAFAIVSGSNCWCSDYAPADTVSTSSCNSPCPGWPYEFCGAPNAGLYGYLALNKSPAGTEGGSAPTSTVAELNSAPNTVTVLATATLTPSVFVSFVSKAPSSPSEVTLVTSVRTPVTTNVITNTATQTSTSWSPTPYASVKTVFGSVQTLIVTPTQPPQAVQTVEPATEVPNNDNSFWSNTGKVAGTFVVVGLLIAALIGAAVFFFFRHLRNHNEAMTVTSNDGDAPTSRNGAPYMVDRRRSNLTLATGGMAGLTRGSSNEKSPVDKTPISMSRRGSIPLGHDQRLNPAALWNSHPNGSHVSVASFRDDQDYSRPVLHVRNPDLG